MALIRPASAPARAALRGAALLLAAPLVALAAAVLAPDAPAGADRGSTSERLAALQDGWRQRAGVHGVVVAVRDGSGAGWTRASGTTTRDGQVPLPPDARFRVASVTKTFVAVVVLQLAAEGRLRLDDAASRYVPGTPGLAGVTIRQLLDHTAGLPDAAAVDEGFGPGLLRDRDRRWTPRELLATSASVARDFPPGTDYAYSNTNYLALGLVVEAVTGTPWATQVRARILDPLRLDGTYVAGAEPGPAVVAAYGDGDNDGDVENLETGREWTSLATSEGPAGALVSTADDLATFAGALFSGRLLDEASLRAMTSTTPYHPRAGGYGLGLEITRPDWATTVWGHGGFLPGFRSTMWYVPAADRVVVVLAGDSRADTADLAELVLRATARAAGTRPGVDRAGGSAEG